MVISSMKYNIERLYFYLTTDFMSKLSKWKKKARGKLLNPVGDLDHCFDAVVKICHQDSFGIQFFLCSQTFSFRNVDKFASFSSLFFCSQDCVNHFTDIFLQMFSFFVHRHESIDKKYGTSCTDY